MIGVGTDSGLVAHWHLHWVMELVSDWGYGHDDILCMTYDIHVDILLGWVLDYATIACTLRWGVALAGDYHY